jgi:hypothetical protein
MLAARGARETAGGGTTAIEDEEEVRQLRRQAGRVHREALGVGVLAVGLAMLARGVLGT